MGEKANGCHVLVCTNLDCQARGSEEILAALQQRVAADGLAHVAVKSYLCFGGCQQGPNLVLYPQRTWYAGVQKDDVDDIISHLKGGPVVSRLTGKVDAPTEELIFQLLDTGLY
jgi:(2Fe-2S) ferredoxin